MNEITNAELLWFCAVDKKSFLLHCQDTGDGSPDKLITKEGRFHYISVFDKEGIRQEVHHDNKVVEVKVYAFTDNDTVEVRKNPNHVPQRWRRDGNVVTVLCSSGASLGSSIIGWDYIVDRNGRGRIGKVYSKEKYQTKIKVADMTLGE